MAALRILTLLLRHGTAKYTDAEAKITEIFGRQLPDVERDTIIVDSALPPDYVECAAVHCTIVGADNTFWEWSAADRGIAFIGERIWSYDLVHLATSAFDQLFNAYLGRFSMPMLRAIAGRPVCTGHIDCYNEPVRLLSFHSQHWVRTSFLFLPPAELKILRTLVGFRDASRLFSGDPRSPFQEAAPLSRNYQDYIYHWLTGADIGQGVQWHSAFGLTRDSLPYFQQKTLAILNEHLFSIRLRAQGCRLIDTTWLAMRLADHPGEPIPWERGWRAQLAERTEDKVIIPPPAAAAQA